MGWLETTLPLLGTDARKKQQQGRHAMPAISTCEADIWPKVVYEGARPVCQVCGQGLHRRSDGEWAEHDCSAARPDWAPTRAQSGPRAPTFYERLKRGFQWLNGNGG